MPRPFRWAASSSEMISPAGRSSITEWTGNRGYTEASGRRLAPTCSRFGAWGPRLTSVFTALTPWLVGPAGLARDCTPAPVLQRHVDADDRADLKPPQVVHPGRPVASSPAPGPRISRALARGAPRGRRGHAGRPGARRARPAIIGTG